MQEPIFLICNDTWTPVVAHTSLDNAKRSLEITHGALSGYYHFVNVNGLYEEYKLGDRVLFRIVECTVMDRPDHL